MSSNLKVNSIVPATGTNVAIGTAGGTITYTASVSGVSTFSNGIVVSGVSTFSNGIVVSAGTTAAPSISPSGDSNTGIFFPSADTVCIGEGGTEVIRVDSSSNVGIKTTSTSGFNGVCDDIVVSGGADVGMTFYSTSTTGSGNIAFTDTVGSDTHGAINYSHSGDYMVFQTSASERMRIDSSGRVTKPYQPSFFAYVTTGDTTVANDTIIVFDGTAHNTGSHYSTSTGRFTAPVTGIYAFHAQIWAKNGSGYSRAIFRIAGSSATQNGFHPGTVGNANDHTFQMSMVRQVTAGDAVDVMTNLGPLTFYGGGASSPHTYFCGYLVG